MIFVDVLPQSVVELECSSININVELRPRSGGFKIGLCVEDLYLRDKMTTGSLCPLLIEPVKRVITVYYPVQNLNVCVYVILLPFYHKTLCY